MSKYFRELHLFSVLEKFSAQGLPLDICIRNYFKVHKSIGSHDRRFLAETIYSMFRWLGLIDYLCSKDHSWERRYEIFKDLDLNAARNAPNLPAHVSVSFPRALFDALKDGLGEAAAKEFCLISNAPAPTTIRTNPLKGDRESLYNKWRNKYDVTLCTESPLGIIFNKRENFFGMPEFKEGYFEVQDEGSQLLSFLVQAKPGQQVLDFCSGSGGKTLGFAPFLKASGQIYLHDIRPLALIEAKKRLKRAGIQNAQVLSHDDPKKNRLKGTMDWVLVDGPCSGTGTLRRNPDMKWRFDPKNLISLQAEQRQIFAEALEFVKPGGKIIYATCSILPLENEEQMQYFLKSYPITLIGTPLKTSPTPGGMDGFFGAVFEKQSI
jgi:16S rRNA (cytosine967-C5)-methyltransferase